MTSKSAPVDQRQPEGREQSRLVEGEHRRDTRGSQRQHLDRVRVVLVVLTADVERERRLAVRRRLDQSPSILTGPQLRVEQPQYVGTPTEPGRDGRHLPSRILGEKPFQY